jgi:peptide/nickel transport system permease protein
VIRVFFRSLILMVVSAFTGSVVIFILLRTVGGDIATVMLGTRATPEALAILRKTFGLNRSWVEQYLSWIGGVFSGNLGEAYTGQYNIATEILHRLEPTLILTFGSLFVAIPISLVIGVYSAMNFKRWRGASVDAVAQVGLAIPQFFLALVLVLVFAVHLGWLPATDYVSIFIDPVVAIRSMVLPIATLSLGITAVFTRFVRTSMIEQMNEDYMRTAKAKGRTARSAAIVHGLRNAAIPLVTTGALQIGALIAGSVVVENVFVIPGIGRLLLTSVMTREAMTVQSLALVILLIILSMNLLMDMLYGLLDPRIRHMESRK